MTLAGPGASSLLAIAFLVIDIAFINLHLASYPQTLVNFFVDVMVTINVFWTIINLFPVLPLDGGQVLRETLGPDRIRLTCTISLMTLIFLAGLLWVGTRSIYNMIVMALLGILYLETAAAEQIAYISRADCRTFAVDNRSAVCQVFGTLTITTSAPIDE